MERSELSVSKCGRRLGEVRGGGEGERRREKVSSR